MTGVDVSFGGSAKSNRMPSTTRSSRDTSGSSTTSSIPPPSRRDMRSPKRLRSANAATADISKLEDATKTALAETKADILEWVSRMMGFQTIVILGAVLGLVVH